MNATTIVVGYDGSANADAAVGWAVAEAADTGATVELLHAYEWPLWTPTTTMVPTLGAWPAAGAEEALKVMLRDAAAAASVANPPVRITTMLVPGAPAPVLRDRSRDASLIVVGSHGHGRFSRLLLGSVSYAVAAHAFCPVIIVRAPDAETAPDRRGVAVGYDGSLPSDLALEFAFVQAAARATPLRVVRAWSPPAPPMGLPNPASAEIPSAERAALLAEIEGWCGKYPTVPVTAEAVLGHPAQVLVETSRQAELVVVGFRGGGGFPGMRLGSVTSRLLHHAACSVAVVRAMPYEQPEAGRLAE